MKWVALPVSMLPLPASPPPTTKLQTVRFASDPESGGIESVPMNQKLAAELVQLNVQYASHHGFEGVAAGKV